MQSMVDSVFSTSASVASWTRASELELYGVIRYEDKAESRPSERWAWRAGCERRNGMIDTPPRKSSICNMRVGRREWMKSVWNISNIYRTVQIRKFHK